ncbi:dienelactone hydrolase family protein [Brevundimonas sp.]|uniref:dienelactone hydrolase family protein n=1 Tax=Brevundimonas sp. TaxID=1871086 RepID=UPI0035AF8217
MPHLLTPEGQTADDLKLSRRSLGLLGGVLFTGYATAALSQSAEPVVTDDTGLVAEAVTYPAPDGFEMPAYIARPEGSGPFPVIVVASEIFGVHAYIEDVCRRLAKAGYAAIAPAFFVRVEDPAPLEDMQQIQRIVAAAGYEQVMGDISGALAWLEQQPWADSERLGITGFCWGGKVTWQAVARFAALKAGVAWYGRLAPAPDASPEQIESGRPWPVDLAADLKAPVLGLYAEEDRGIPLTSVETMRAALTREGAEGSSIEVYPGAQHGFHADYRASYKADAAADGWAKMLAHFERWVRGA